MERRYLYASMVATILLFLMVAIRVAILATNTRLADLDDVFYLTRQVTYTVTWFWMLEFFLYNYIEWRRIIATGSKRTFAVMEWISLITMFMCIVQSVVLFFHHQDDLINDADGLMAAHNLIEIMAWLAMAVFLGVFFFYHRGHRIEYISKRNRRAKLLEEMVYHEANRAAEQDE